MKRFKVLVAVLITLFCCNLLFAQTLPQTINYQGLLKDGSGNLVNGNAPITFSLYDVSTGGAALWTETKTIDVDNGVFNTQLGSISPITLPFTQQYWLGVKVLGTSELTPRISLASVPYSFMTMNVTDNSITSAKIQDGTITSSDIGNNQIVKSINGLKDDVNLVAGSNVSITPSGNNLTISSSGGSGGGTLDGSGTTNYVPLFIGTTTLGNSILYQNSNNIGIGTISPLAKLDVNGDSYLRGNLFFPGTTPSISFYDNGYIQSADQYHRITFNRENDQMEFQEFGDIIFLTTSDKTERMRITSSGRVGIGTSNPGFTLHVKTNDRSAGYFTSNSQDFYDIIRVRYDGTGDYSGTGVYAYVVPNDHFGTGGGFEGGYMGVYGSVKPTGNQNYYGASGVAEGGSGHNYAVYGYAAGSGTNYAIYGSAVGSEGIDWAGYFLGNVNISGTLTKSAGSFKIDHPLDPENKYLYHSFVESPDMMNIYNGNVVTDVSGFATVILPDWFEALNKDFRYQLTVIGDFAQAIISQKIHKNQFVIRTDKPNIEVSWQVTGIRHDPYADKNRIPIEEIKNDEERTKYIHPEVYGLPETRSIDYNNTKFDRSIGEKNN
jgi:hypothetical protein